jgi:hypothetical protein
VAPPIMSNPPGSICAYLCMYVLFSKVALVWSNNILSPKGMRDLEQVPRTRPLTTHCEAEMRCVLESWTLDANRWQGWRRVEAKEGWLLLL